MTTKTVELDDEQWIAERDATVRHFLGIGADEFAARFRAGAYDRDEPDALMTVLAYFPELD
jgi:hypothetical protein